MSSQNTHPVDAYAARSAFSIPDALSSDVAALDRLRRNDARCRFVLSRH
jgi:hypothetical protein